MAPRATSTAYCSSLPTTSSPTQRRKKHQCRYRCTTTIMMCLPCRARNRQRRQASCVRASRNRMPNKHMTCCSPVNHQHRHHYRQSPSASRAINPNSGSNHIPCFCCPHQSSNHPPRIKAQQQLLRHRANPNDGAPHTKTAYQSAFRTACQCHWPRKSVMINHHNPPTHNQPTERFSPRHHQHRRRRRQTFIEVSAVSFSTNSPPAGVAMAK